MGRAVGAGQMVGIVLMKFPLPHYIQRECFRLLWLDSDDLILSSSPALNGWLWLWDGVTGHQPVLVPAWRRLDRSAMYVEILDEVYDVRQIEGGLWFPDYQDMYEKTEEYGAW